ncbi:MAG TPA: TetR/AcrR family transcriptional regulator [Rhizomicrobium sp.]|nr:TetR/AcrR family transcriptional regulator [Rhizomicrobium sp.]
MPRALSKAEVQDFRDRLCAAASRIFAAKGLSGFTMRELAAALGVSPMTPYRYFKDKDEILAAVQARAYENFSATLEAAFNARPRPHDGPSAIAAASAVAEAYIRFALDDPDSYRLMFDIPQHHRERYPGLARAQDRARATLTRHVEPLIATGMVRGDPNVIGHVYWATIHGVVMLQMSGGLGYPIETILDAAFRALAVGFSAPG